MSALPEWRIRFPATGIPTMSTDTLRITAALDFACRKHVHQRRKGENREPYINHLAEVAHLVAQATGGDDADLIVAALLHDSVEDQGVKREEIAERFGEDVAALVMEVTDDRGIPRADRKQAQVDHAAHISPRAQVLKIADKTSNLRSVLNSPPNWPLARKRRYFAWAKAVVAGARGTNMDIEEAFDAAYENAVAAGIAERGFEWHVRQETEDDD